MAHEIRALFRNLMQLVVVAEEAQERGGRLLASFVQELELFRRPPLDKTSPLVAVILTAMPGVQLQTYLEAGCRHPSAASQNAARLDALFKALSGHLAQLQDLQQQVNEVLRYARDALTASSARAASLVGHVDCGDADLALPSKELPALAADGGSGQDAEEELREKGQGQQPWRTKEELTEADYVTMMASLAGMLEEDFSMQEVIMTELDLGTPSEHLASYEAMWSLRPLVDERVMAEALTWL